MNNKFFNESLRKMASLAREKIKDAGLWTADLLSDGNGDAHTVRVWVKYPDESTGKRYPVAIIVFTGLDGAAFEGKSQWQKYALDAFVRSKVDHAITKLELTLATYRDTLSEDHWADAQALYDEFKAIKKAKAERVERILESTEK